MITINPNKKNKNNSFIEVTHKERHYVVEMQCTAVNSEIGTNKLCENSINLLN